MAKLATKPVEPRDRKSSQLSNDEKTTILTLSASGVGVGEIGAKIGRSSSTVSRFIARMFDTSDLARATLKAGAVTLAERIIKKGEVRDAIEVLSRPGIDVLQPPKKEVSGGFNIGVSVAIGSLGTVVKVNEEVSNASKQLQGVRPDESQDEGPPEAIEGVVSGVEAHAASGPRVEEHAHVGAHE